MSDKIMKIELVFEDWKVDGKSVYNTELGVNLSMGQFHSGTTFSGTIYLDEDDEKELSEAIKNGYSPIFRIYLDER